MGDTSPAAALTIRRMQDYDVNRVAEIERRSFAHGWPPTAFRRELTNNRVARYVVLDAASGSSTDTVAFGGLWLQLDEAHIVTVAVEPAHRRSGFGLVVVQALLDLARSEGMQTATLEVRVSNEAARQLYRRCGFYEVGERKRYYSDNHEDAVIMSTEPFDSDGFARHYERLSNEVRARFERLRSTLA